MQRISSASHSPSEPLEQQQQQLPIAYADPMAPIANGGWKGPLTWHIVPSAILTTSFWLCSCVCLLLLSTAITSSMTSFWLQYLPVTILCILKWQILIHLSLDLHAKLFYDILLMDWHCQKDAWGCFLWWPSYMTHLYWFHSNLTVLTSSKGSWELRLGQHTHTHTHTGITFKPVEGPN